MHLDTLDAAKRQTIVTQARAIGAGYYLAGGTALALHLGHRTSRDLDWFTADNVDQAALQQALGAAIPIPTHIGAKGVNAIRFFYDSLETSFITYRPMTPQIERVMIDGVAVPLASLEQIAAMKASALIGRAEKRDYVDVYALCLRPDWSVRRFLDNAKRLLGIQPPMLVRALTYFDDAESKEMPQRSVHSWQQVKDGLRRMVADLPVT